MTDPLALSQEEQAELTRSNKKVKNVNHTDYGEGQDAMPPSPNHSFSPWNRAVSFKDRLMGEIPGAFSQAFKLVDNMEDESDSEEAEVEALREGLATVSFSKEFKRQIRKPWGCAFIVKVFGRSVGFTFLHNRLLSLWKPAGRLECVDLGHGFFLTRFSLREDYDAILKKGPWFIGEHFLSIRPWEPDFRPATANVSSIAVWIRLNELPIEYYNEEALVQIGKSIGTVLRIDTHTASETRGRFARLCVQIDVTKPLVTGIFIGKFEQSVSYEGIHRLCFDCGRVGHQKENCPFTIRRDPPPLSSEMEAEVDVVVSSCGVHVADEGKDMGGPTGSVLAAVHEEASIGTYGPWVVVTRKKTKNFRSSGTHSPQGFVPSRQVQGTDAFTPRNADGPVIADISKEGLREAKRKLPAPKVINGAQLNNVLQGLRKVPNHQAHHAPNDGPLQPGLKSAHSLKGFGKGTPKVINKFSVKGKKDFVRARVHRVQSGAVDGASSSVSSFEVLPREESPVFSADADRHQGEPSNFHFSAKVQSEMDAVVHRSGSGFLHGESSEPTFGCGLSQSVDRGGLAMDRDVDENDCTDGRGSSVQITSTAQIGSLDVHACDEGAKSRADEGMEDAGWMELEGGGEANAAV